MIQTCFEFDSLYFEICLGVEFCDLGFKQFNFDKFAKSPNPVTPANAGVQKLLK